MQKGFERIYKKLALVIASEEWNWGSGMGERFSFVHSCFQSFRFCFAISWTAYPSSSQSIVPKRVWHQHPLELVYSTNSLALPQTHGMRRWAYGPALCALAGPPVRESEGCRLLHLLHHEGSFQTTDCTQNSPLSQFFH